MPIDKLYSPISQKLEPFLTAKEGKVRAFPFRCGAGKSTAIREIIPYMLEKREGIIIATDSIERLNSYLYETKEMREWTEKHQKDVVLLTRENYSTEMERVQYCPILLMTTQRYFAADKEVLKTFWSWNDGGFKKKRACIIFDEKPEFIKFDIASAQTPHQIISTLEKALDNTVDEGDKQCLIDQIARRGEVLKSELFRRESTVKLPESSKGTLLYCKIPIEKDSSGVEHDTIKALLKDYRKKINACDPNTLAAIGFMEELFAGSSSTDDCIPGAFYFFRPAESGEYISQFITLRSNRAKMMLSNVNTIILDATANVAPEYKILNWVEVINCDDFDVDMSHCTINCINIPTARSKIASTKAEGKAITKIITDQIHEQQGDEPVVFTYKTLKKCFNGCRTEHLGNIKGRNNWRNDTVINQVGLMRKPDIFYLLMALFSDKAMMGQLSNVEELQTRSILEALLKDKYFNKIMTLSLAEDIIQNIFRGTVRNILPAGDNKPYTYNLYCNTTEYKDLIDLLNQLHVFEGADILRLPTPMIYSFYSSATRSGDTHPKTIINWLINCPFGRCFKIKELQAETGITSSQFKDLKKDSACIKNLFDQMKIAQNARSYVMTAEARHFLDKLSSLM